MGFQKKVKFRNKCGVSGFSLLEMSIVLVIIAVIVAGGAITFSASVQQKQFESTKDKMLQVQKILRDYWISFGRLPCPANLENYAITDANFGVAAPDTGTCTGSTPAANFSSGNTVAGMIPTKTLRLPDEYAFDGWGRRIFYAVDKRLTATTAYLDVPAASTDVDNSTTRITVMQDASATKTTQAIYVVISYGPNGHGAYPRYSQSGTTRVYSGSVNTMERVNCHCTALGVDDGAFSSTFYQAPYSTDTSTSTDTFDDIVLFATRSDLASPKE